MITGACCSSSSLSLSSTSSSLSKSDYSVVLDSGLSLSGSRETNLDRFLEHTTLVVPAQYLSKEISAI